MSGTRYAILFAFGADRPGIVRQVAGFVSGHGCNITDSRMAVLGGRFVIMMLVSGSEQQLKGLGERIEEFCGESGLRIMLVDADDPRRVRAEPALPVRLEIVAMDAPGILVRVADVLHKHGVNVENLESRAFPAPSSGSMVFSAKMLVMVPQKVPLSRVKQDLAALAEQMNLEVLFQPVHE